MTSNDDINKFNSMIRELQKMITCDGPCQKKKEAENLKQKMLDAKTNIISAPSQYQVAQKNYVTFTEGEDAYSKLYESELKEKADEIIKDYKEKYDETTKKIKTQIETYEGIFINFENVMDLYLKYKNENDELFKQV
jgi:hypothetical protein